MNLLQEILDWSEVWAPLIPLAILMFKPNQPNCFKPVIIYLWFALFIDILIDVGWKFGKIVPFWMYPNNYLYNVHSIVRFICFSTFFIRLNQPYYTGLKKAIPIISIVLLSINFIFFENFYNPQSFSSRLLAGEAV